MTGLGVLLPLIVTFIAGPLSKGDNTQVTGINSEVLKSSHNITERAAECPEDLHREGEFCCQLCPPGTRKDTGCTTDRGKPGCVPCPEGEEYTDKAHYSSKCRRCRICDGEQGVNMESVRIAHQPTTPNVKDPDLTFCGSSSSSSSRF
uniref:Tumor necrosis factor receptor superfamily member 6 n=2 Tax=Rousettus aegyptiacus TaxID=9407 RepID=A0A7J8G7I6_ROUAE|nr:Fas cell surface death receptor [Rousettus aegyptiacus]